MIWPAGHPLQNDKYIIETVLGQVGFGITYKAKHVHLDGHVVIKTPNDYLKHDPDYNKYVDRFIKEGQFLERLSQKQHPNIVRVRDLFEEAGIHCIVMDFVPGENLFQLVRQRGALPEAEIVPIIRQIADALSAMHQAGLVHRDAQPGNIIVQNGGKAILIDFGIAEELIPSTQSTVGAAGNHGFAPYEQMTGRSSLEPSVDVYCLAATFYFAVTGERPANALDRKLNNTHLISPRQLKPRITSQTNQAILKGMALEPKDRPQSIQAWLDLLTNLHQKEIRSSQERRLLSTIKQEINARLRNAVDSGKLINLPKELLLQQIPPFSAIENKTGNRTNELLSSHLTVLDIFNRPEVAGRLLILGAPGSGKTTALLELAQNLVSQAEEQSDCPIPVVLNLRTWAKKNSFRISRLLRGEVASIEQWLINELKAKYGLQPVLGKKWLEENKFLVILNGLDEVGTSQKLEVCIKAINDFLMYEKAVHLVVSCRATAYSNSPVQLRLNGVLNLLPLTQAQVIDYLTSANYPELRQAFRSDPKFAETLQTPLLMTVAVAAFRETSAHGLNNLGSLETLSQLESSQVKCIEEVVSKARKFPEGKVFYSLYIVVPTHRIFVGQSIEIRVQVVLGISSEDGAYLLELFDEDLSENELSMFLDAPEFYFDDSIVYSLTLNLEAFEQQSIQTCTFHLTCLKAGLNTVRVEFYYGNSYETTLKATVRVASPEGYTSLPVIASRSRPIPQPDLILQVQTIWNENLSTFTFRYSDPK